MRTLLRALFLLACAPLCRAETNACTTISALPAVITTPGSYCLEQDLTDAVGLARAIHIIDVSDVVLDCNGFRLSGVRPTAASAATFTSVGIGVGSGARVTIRNCRISGFDTGISVQRSGDTTTPRSSNILIEGNVIEGAGIGIYEVSEGNTRVRDNVITGSLLRGLQVYSAPGQTFVSNNTVSRTGDTVNLAGEAAYIDAYVGTGGWMVVENNTFMETVAPPGGSPTGAVQIRGFGPIGLTFINNRVLAPANAAEKGSVTTSLTTGQGITCSANVIVGYGAALPAACPGPSNKAY